MKNLKNFGLGALVGAALMVATSGANASGVYTFLYNDGPQSVSGLLTLTNQNVTGFGDNGATPAFSGPITGSIGPNGITGGSTPYPGTLLSADGQFLYDNFSSLNAPFIDNGGILFTATTTVNSPWVGGGGNQGFWNIYENVNGDPSQFFSLSYSDGNGWHTVSSLGTFVVGAFEGPGGGPVNGNGDPIVSTTPLPSTWTLLLAGFLGLGFLAVGKSKKGSVAHA